MLRVGTKRRGHRCRATCWKSGWSSCAELNRCSPSVNWSIDWNRWKSGSAGQPPARPRPAPSEVVRGSQRKIRALSPLAPASPPSVCCAECSGQCVCRSRPLSPPASAGPAPAKPPTRSLAATGASQAAAVAVAPAVAAHRFCCGACRAEIVPATIPRLRAGLLPACAACPEAAPPATLSRVNCRIFTRRSIK